MYRKIKSLISDVSIYGLAELMNRAMQVFFLPIIFAYIKPHDFGILDFFLTAKNLLSIGLGWGIITSIQRFAYKDIEASFKEVISVSIWYILLVDVILSVLIIVTIYFFLGPKNIIYFEAIVATVITSLFFAIRSVPLGVLRLKRKPRQFLVVSVSNIIVYLLLTFLFITLFDLSYMAFLYGGLIAIVVSCFIGIIFIKKWITFDLNYSLAKRLFGFGLSVLSTSLVFNFLNSTNRFFLKFQNSFSDIAVLGMANRLSVFVGGLLIAPFGLAWLPFVNENFEREDFEEIFNKIYVYVTFIGLLLTLIISLFAEDILAFANDAEYMNAAFYVPIFSLIFVFQGYYYLFATGIYLQKNRRNYYLISLFSCLFNLLLYFLFFNYLDVLVVSIITLSTYILVFLMAYYFGKSKINVPIINTEIIVCFFSFFLLLSINSDLVISFNLVTEYVVKVLSIILFIGLVGGIPSMRMDLKKVLSKYF